MVAKGIFFTENVCELEEKKYLYPANQSRGFNDPSNAPPLVVVEAHFH